MQELKPGIAEPQSPFDERNLDKSLEESDFSIPTDYESKESAVLTNTKGIPESDFGELLSLSSRSQMRADEGAFASIQRPEPLGKAKAEIHLVSGRSSVSQVASLLKPHIDSNSSAHTSSTNESSDDGLNEQEFPVRVPLSIAEGGNGISTMVFEQPGTTLTAENKDNSSNNSDRDVELSPKSVEVSTYSAIDAKNSGSGDLDQFNGIELGTGKDGPNTPISTLLEPAYKSSIALLEELKRRRLQFDRITENVGSTGKNEQGHGISPFELAESAMKASNILSTKTAKSLKKASLVLKAVEEHRSPPTDLSSSLSLESLKMQSSGRSINSDASLSSFSSSKDSIDKLLEARLRRSKSSSRSSTLTHSGLHTEDHTAAVNTSDALTSSSKSVNLISGESVDVQSSDERPSKSRGIIGYSSESNPRSTISDATSSELLQLEEVPEDVDSPLAIAMADRFKSQTNDISPIEKQNKLPVIGNRNFRSSSRIRDGNITRFRVDNQVSDVEIVEMHRSLGAGTVTPLPSTRAGTSNEPSSDEISYARPSGGQDHLVFHDRASAFSSTSDNTESKILLETQDSAVRIDENNDLALKQTFSTKEGSGNIAEDVPKVVGRNGSAFRGIYDVRDSTGPGSSNRRRMLSGKEPSRQKQNKIDPFDVYVTEGSKSSLSLASEKDNTREKSVQKAKNIREALGENAQQGKLGGDISTGDDMLSSMSSEFPVLSYEEQGSTLDKGTHHQDLVYSSINEEFISTDSERDTNHSDINWKKTKSETTSSVREGDQTNSKNKRKQILVDTIGTRSIRHRDLNKLWEKFRDRFNYDHDSSSNDGVLGKIEKLEEILNQNSGFSEKKSTGEQERFRSSRPSRNTEITNISKWPIGRKTESKPFESSCPNCCKRNAETNCPTPIPFDFPVSEHAQEQPLLLHMWTQTTPNVKVSKQLEDAFKSHQGGKDGVKSASTTHQPPNAEKELRHIPEKENMQWQANSLRERKEDSDKREPSSSSWNVAFEEIPASNGTKKAHMKPPVSQISKGMVHSDVARKKKEPVFTAWFQSTRSDTSSGTVVPLSTVPKLADAYNESKRVPKLLIKDIQPKNTE